MQFFACPYLGKDVELTDERSAHVAAEHADLLPYLDGLADVLREPDVVRRPPLSPDARLFARWYDELVQPRYIIVVVVSHEAPERHWIVTAYSAHRLTGDLEWKRS